MGISDAIPVEEAYRRGAETIVVIRTVPSQAYYTPQWLKRIEQWLSESSLQQLVRIMQQHERSYHRIQQFIEKPPGDVRIFEIFPSKPLASKALGSGAVALNRDYHLGRRCGRYFLATIGRWLLPRESLGIAIKPLFLSHAALFNHKILSKHQTFSKQRTLISRIIPMITVGLKNALPLYSPQNRLPRYLISPRLPRCRQRQRQCK